MRNLQPWKVYSKNRYARATYYIVVKGTANRKTSIKKLMTVVKGYNFYRVEAFSFLRAMNLAVYEANAKSPHPIASAHEALSHS